MKKISERNARIALAADHRGVSLKSQLAEFLKKKGLQPVDFGPQNEASCDYPDFILPAAEAVAKGDCQAAIGICYTGIGSVIAANKVKGVRAALVEDIERAKLTRQHNDSNMLILAAGFHTAEELLKITEVWLNTDFEGGRHEHRVGKIKSYEEKHLSV